MFLEKKKKYLNKYLLRELLWIIPNNDFEGVQIDGQEFIDGKVVSFSKKIGEAHLEFFSKLFDKLRIEKPNSWDDITCALKLAEKGFATVVNSGRPIDGKYFATIFLPKQMSLKQIEFFEENKSLLLENYHDHLLEIAIYIDVKPPYNSSYRNLKIEKIIEGKKEYSNLDMFYEELQKQKEFIKTK